ncbi:MAG: exodeoxyribonuclease VII large subunit [Paludibacteraceae bacterium]|nr:exodeoxyribonuclease VII large subunit [Paludibacteraceae bacterium]
MTSLSLYQLNQLIKESLRQVIPTTIWLRAEIHNITTNYSGHCYIDLVEKSDFNDQIIAKQRATIWASTYRFLAQKFHQATNSSLQVGMKILVEVSIEFHELYGLSLNVRDIDPTYTLGELQRRRLEIIQRLKNRGLIDKNKQLPMPRLVQRIAVISSPTAAGYADFVHQLQNNPHGFAYSITLFPAIMQGPQTEESILSALSAIEATMGNIKNCPPIHRGTSVAEGVNNFITEGSKTKNSSFLISHSSFDIVVIIRGGGATSDLQAFDSEPLAERCANFPLPILTGIGHLRDETILDMVAHHNLKTPTAVAEYIISRTLDVSFFLDEMAEKIQTSIRIRLEKESNYLLLLSAQIPQIVQRQLTQSANHINDLQYRMQLKTADFIAKNRLLLDRKSDQLSALVNQQLQQQQNNLKLIETKLQLLDPQQLLKKGYSFTTHNGKLVTSITQLTPGDTITTTLADGTVNSVVK